MATKETKQWALTTALQLLSKAAEGGYQKTHLFTELESLYKKLIELQEDVDK